jgi:hypothetical protein
MLKVLLGAESDPKHIMLLGPLIQEFDQLPVQPDLAV